MKLVLKFKIPCSCGLGWKQNSAKNISKCRLIVLKCGKRGMKFCPNFSEMYVGTRYVGIYANIF